MSELKCPICGAAEIDSYTPRTVYACGSSDYDQRPGTLKPVCHESAELAEAVELLKEASLALEGVSNLYNCSIYEEAEAKIDDFVAKYKEKQND